MHLTASKELANISLKCCLLGYFTLYFSPAAILKAHPCILRAIIEDIPCQPYNTHSAVHELQTKETQFAIALCDCNKHSIKENHHFAHTFKNFCCSCLVSAPLLRNVIKVVLYIADRSRGVFSRV